MRRHAGRGRGHDPRARREAVALDRLGAGDDDRRGAVGERRRAAGRDDAVGLEGRLELGQRLERWCRPAGPRPRLTSPLPVSTATKSSASRSRLAAVSCWERRPQASESSRLMPSRIATSSAVSPRLMVALPPSRSLNLRVDQAPAQRGVGHVGGGRPRPRALGQDHRRARHRLHAAGHDDVGLAAADLLRGRRDGLQAAGAQPVDGVAGGLVGQAGEQRGHARDVAVVLARLVGGAEDHLVDRVVGHAGALERGAEHERGEVVGSRVGEGAAIAPEGRADAADEEGIGHAERSKRSVSRVRTATISSSLIPCSWSS